MPGAGGAEGNGLVTSSIVATSLGKSKTNPRVAVHADAEKSLPSCSGFLSLHRYRCRRRCFGYFAWGASGQNRSAARPCVQMDCIRFEYGVRFRFFTKSNTTMVEKTEIVGSIGDSFPATRNHRSIGDFAL